MPFMQHSFMHSRNFCVRHRWGSSAECDAHSQEYIPLSKAIVKCVSVSCWLKAIHWDYKNTFGLCIKQSYVRTYNYSAFVSVSRCLSASLQIALYFLRVSLLPLVAVFLSVCDVYLCVALPVFSSFKGTVSTSNFFFIQPSICPFCTSHPASQPAKHIPAYTDEPAPGKILCVWPCLVHMSGAVMENRICLSTLHSWIVLSRSLPEHCNCD